MAGIPARTAATALTVAFFALAAPAAHGASSEGKFAVKEAGTQSCERFVAERKKRSNAYFAFLGWVAGYVSFYNKATPDTTDVMSWQTIDLVDLLLNNFCTANPKTLYIAAVDKLVKALHPGRLRNPSEMVVIKGDKRPIHLYKNVLLRIQQILTERGYYKRKIDGAFGPATSAAIKAFQRESKMNETGYPDQLTLLRLFQ